MPTSGSGSEPDLGSAQSCLTVVAGKGGVGRSTVAAGLARDRANAGRRVLVVDAIDDGGLEAALSAAPRPPSLKVLRLTTEQSLQQYIDLFLPLPLSPSRIGPVARILDYVATAAPGVREILTLGKIAWEVREGPWDHVVVDAPATGHVIELLAAADTLGDLIGSGPLAAQTDWMGALLANPDRCGIVVVAAPEELPVTETLELLERLDSETRVAVRGLLVNRVPSVVTASDESHRLASDTTPLGQAVKTAVQRSELWLEQRARLLDTALPMCTIGESADPLAAVSAKADIVLTWTAP